MNKGSNFDPFFLIRHLDAWWLLSLIQRILEKSQVSERRVKMMFLLNLDCQRNSPVKIFRRLLNIHVWEDTFVSYNINDNVPEASPSRSRGL